MNLRVLSGTDLKERDKETERKEEKKLIQKKKTIRNKHTSNINMPRNEFQ